MLDEIADPGAHIPEELEHDLYVELAGPDVVSDKTGIDRLPLEAALKKLGDINYIDYAPLVDEFSHGNPAPLHAELMAQNRAGVPQLLCVFDMSALHKADGSARGAPLYTYDCKDVHHAIVRAGFSDDSGYGLYFDPASPGFKQPVPILWADIVAAQIITAIAVLPHGMPIPPSGFLFQHGTWPPVQPRVDIAAALSTVESMAATIAALSAALNNVRADLGAKAS